MTAEAKLLNSSGSLFEVRTKKYWYQSNTVLITTKTNNRVWCCKPNCQNFLFLTHPPTSASPTVIQMRCTWERKRRGKFLPFLFFVCWSFFSQLGLTWSFFHFYSLLPVFIGFASRHPFFSETSLEFLLIPFPLSRCPYFLSNAKRLSPSSTLLPVSLVLHTCTVSSF